VRAARVLRENQSTHANKRHNKLRLSCADLHRLKPFKGQRSRGNLWFRFYERVLPTFLLVDHIILSAVQERLQGTV
jgi:hypothetical protein